MTAQRQDYYRYKGKNFDLLAVSDSIPFSPEDYGLTPHMSSTACYRGYWCGYEITDEGMFLEELYLYNRNGEYPDFAGTPVSPQTFHDQGHRLYRGVHLQIPYTGRLLIGADFLRQYYIHMGFQQPFAYKMLTELVLRDGFLQETIDRSGEAAKMREAIDLEDPSWKYGDRNIRQFVRDCFSLEYERKAWWLQD